MKINLIMGIQSNYQIAKAMRNRILLFLLLLSLTTNYSLAQNNILKIYSEILKSENDSVKVGKYFSLADEYYRIKNYANCFKSYDTALRISENAKRQDLVASCYINIGSTHSNLQEFVAANNSYEKAGILLKQQNDFKILARLYFSYGNNYYFLNDTKKAIAYYRLVLNCAYKSKDSSLLSDTYNNIGISYASQENYELAKVYMLKAYYLAVFEKDTAGIAYYYNNTGSIYNNLGLYDSAIVNLEKSKYFKELLGSKSIRANANLNLSSPYIQQRNYKKALYYLGQCEKYLDTSEYSMDLLHFYTSSYTANKELGNYKLANLFLEKSHRVKDSLNRFQTLEDVEYQEKLTEYKNSMVRDSLHNAGKIQAKNLELKRSETIRYFMIVLVLVVAVFLILLYKRFKIIQKQKQEIELQKNIIQEKAEEIISSINYAKRIQQSILPNESYVKKQLNKN